ncbi:8-oxo-dGTP diphosphatase [Prauserella shujinwangii]|uniref:8-oxo-dGTP diphosphatase n=1 Tax=Prauserella shujinwangii TaxID=1453103 RepID=A0A2T0M2M5_9PSEU|nr:NUDIX domain-containing protein [Prauserella shujinwangii]PRX50959.1 8-oxo-dGTP diphosphatase [Prauserella shujinwangii]
MNDERNWKIPEVAVSVDVAILTVRSGALHILLVWRAIEPFAGMRALPGGFLSSVEEDIDVSARRELAEETGLDADRFHLEQLRTYGAPRRDPRMRVVTVCYLALVPNLPDPVAGGDASAASWVPVAEVLEGRLPLAFDHHGIVLDAVERARSKIEYTTLATAFCDEEFTVAELREVYEIVWGEIIDPRNFHRKVTGAKDFLVPTGRKTTRNGGRPAELYRRGTATLLHPAFLRGHQA